MEYIGNILKPMDHLELWKQSVEATAYRGEDAK